ncbi:PAS domain S-box protein [Myxococcota bacterium]|nr:PAS domain S-box protein [Myxococcota bacterium]MBU1380346.1 PAS domain S-box protein [Myxococcota bacterium]MBU1498213.1 PAS domain S-box protein [Myxococcota bacterium]
MITNETYLEILENSLAGYWDWDIKTGYEYLSPGFKKMFGYDDHEIENTAESWQKLIFAEDLPGVIKKFDAHVKSRGKDPYYNEVRYRHKNGSTIWVICTGRITEWDSDGNPLRMVGCHIDITERKRIEESLRLSELRYRSLVSNMPMVSFVIGSDGIFQVSEGLGLSKLGLKPHEVEGLSVYDVYKDYPEILRAITDALSGKETREELEVMGIVFDVLYQPVFDEGGRVTRIIGVATDITQRKRTEEELRISKNTLKSITDNATDFIFIKNKNRQYTYVNRAMCRLLGAEESQILGKTPVELFGKEQGETINKVDNMAFNGETVNVTELLTIGEQKKYFNTVQIPLEKDGPQVLSVMGIVRDITSRMLAEKNLVHEKERLFVTLKSIGDAVITTDTGGCIILMNHIAEELTGWTLDEVSGKSLEEVFVIENEYSGKRCENPVERVIKTGKVVELANHTVLVNRDGSRKAISDSGAPIIDDEGNIIGVVLVFRDVSEKKKMAEVLRRADKLEALGVLASGIAHDFNNLLSGVFGFIDLAREETTSSEVRMYLSEANSAINRARALTQQLLTFSRGGEPHKRLTNPATFIRETVGFALSGSRISAEFHMDSDLYHGEMDKHQISQVIDNIVINAQQAMPLGGVITVECRNQNFPPNEHGTLGGGNYISISIKDTGVGIPPDIKSKVFDPFFTTKSKGHGLGLATSYSIISRHGGTIDVESYPGKGSTFTIYLPASEETVGAKSTVSAQVHAGEGRILVMDDEEVIRKSMEMILKSMGYMVLCVTDGREAINVFSSLPKDTFRCLIFDLTIPGGMGGLDTINEIRKLNPSIPVIVSSGYAEDPVLSNPIKYGFNGGLTKPFLKSELAQVLEQCLGK